jgi:hypothetical protein
MLSGKLATKASALIGVPSQNGRSNPLPLMHGAALCSNEFGQNNTVASPCAPILSKRYEERVRTTVSRTPAPIAIKRTAPRDLMTPNYQFENVVGGTDLSDGIFALLAIRLGSIIVSLSLPHAANGRLVATNSTPSTSAFGRFRI